MAEIKGIDVSANQGNINWKTVANYGMGFAILRITEKGNVIDHTFERNYKGCKRSNEGETMQLCICSNRR